MITSTTASAVRRGNVRITGDPDGPTLVLAHGFGCDQDMWRRVLPAFVATHRVVLFDHVGAGRSDHTAYDPERYSTLEGYAADVVEIAEELDLHDAVLVGHSVSAMIAAAATTAAPDRFGRLVMVAPSPRYVDDPETGYVGGFSAEDIEDLLVSMDSNYFAWAASIAPMVMGNADNPELGEELTGSFCATDPTIARQFARVTFQSDARALLAAVPVPTLVLQCRDDVLAPDEVGVYVAEQIPDATLVRLEATGHCPHVSAPEETAAVILDHLRDV